MRSKLVRLCRPKKPERDWGGIRSRYWPASLPFYFNPRGILVHRVRYAQTHWHNGEPSHDSVTYWCANIGRDGEFLAEPPKERLLCSYCEARAVASGQKSAQDLVGRHVHVGRLRPERVCCRQDRN